MNKEQIYKKLGNFIKVENMTSSRGNDIPNQFELTFSNGRVFQSYNSVISIILNDSNVYYLGDDWDYSVTTSKYRNLFLNNDKKTVLEDLEEKKAILIRGL